MNIDLEQYCEYFYASHYIPVALFANHENISCYSPFNLFLRACPLVSASEHNPDIFVLQDQGMYGVIRMKNSSHSILVGPVFSNGITHDMLLAIARNNLIPQSELETLGNFLTSIPPHTYHQFLYLIAYLHYSLNQETFDITEFFLAKSENYRQSIPLAHTKNSYLASENQQIHNSFQFENTLLSYVRDGEVEKLNAFLLQTVKTSNFQEGILADTPLRQAKNLFLGFVAIVGKIGAIGGGMNVEEAYRLIDLYSQECEKALSVDSVKMLQYNMLQDFTERVARCKAPKFISSEIFSCMQFIQNHTNFSIGINDVAKHIQKSRTYLTKKFRQECGMSVTDFITQSKLRDAMRLLQYSNQSLSEISNYLCFSSQSYFQTVFKQHIGMTPNEYRQRHTMNHPDM